MKPAIIAIEAFFPERILDNLELAASLTGWTAEKIEDKTGIRRRHIAAPGECSSDLAVKAAEKLFASEIVRREEIDFVIVCTQTPDYLLPTTACLVQSRLRLPTSCGALDVNMGCSGFVYTLALAKGLIESHLARHILLLTAETYSKLIHPHDKSVKTIFGDAAAATLISGVTVEQASMGPFVFGTDGTGGDHLIVPTGGARRPFVPDAPEITDKNGNGRTVNNIFMNGPEIFNFTLQVVPDTVAKLLQQSGKRIEDIDLFVFHQANRYMLEHLRNNLRIPAEKFVLAMADCGNTVSSSIPIALKDAVQAGRLKPGMCVMLLGFGVGLSWCGSLIVWT